ncbi:MAG: NADP-dependent malic enzyme [Patescibacteria group bacterium]|nr:NADP-dependent malic enzyme [Patescibacteria group bacterium]
MNSEKSLHLHEKLRGKIEVTSRAKIRTKRQLGTLYTPGVAEPCKVIHKNPNAVYKYTRKWNSVAVVTDGSAVLGLGNIGSRAGLPVMEGKCMLFKQFADIDAFPICLETQDTEEIIKTVKNIAPGFGAINLEDISAPRCFDIERRLAEELDIPVFHDDQHGTAVVLLAGLINALKVAGKRIEGVKIVISGAGAAGIAIADLLLKYGAKHMTLFDSKGAVFDGRVGLDPEKARLAKMTNKNHFEGPLPEGIAGADVFIGVSVPGVLTTDMVKSMAGKPIIFAMANPKPEISPEDAKEGGAYIYASGRSDYPNQINNVLAFPGIIRGLLDSRARHLTDEMKIAAAEALARIIKNPSPKKIIPDVFNKKVVSSVAKVIK